MKGGDLDNRSELKLLRPRFPIHVAADGKYRRDELELCENFRRTHVSRVKDELHALQGAPRFRPKKPVSIGNDADPHVARRLISPCPGPGIPLARRPREIGG